MQIITPYAYNDGANGGTQEVVPFAGVTGRMAKRRRVESDEYGSHGLPLGASFGSNNGGGVEPPSGIVASGAAQDTANASALNENTESSSQWNGVSASPYPDISSYSQQPYFQQTEPDPYNSPWPPTDTATFGTQANNFSIPAPTTEMPYFPAQTPVETRESTFDTTNVQQPSFQRYQHETEISTQYAAYVQPPSNNDQARRTSDGQNQTSPFSYEDASMHLKIQSLPILENLATQLIHTIAKASFPQIQEIISGNDTEDSQAYTTLKNLFDQTRKVYSRETPFIDAIAIQMFQPNQQEIIRKANIATFISSILGAHDVSFFHLNEFFMETFVPLGHRLLKWQGAIYLELKTQTYISALMNSDGSPEAMLDELFPPDLDAQILTRHPDAPSLSPSEQDFIDRSRARTSYLLAGDSIDDAVRDLPKKYQWHDFVREFASCISKNIDGIMNVPARAQPVFGTSALDRRTASAAQALQDTLARSNQSLATGSSRSGLSGVQGLSLSGQSGQSGAAAASGQRESNDGARKASAAASTIRQPWTKSEEDALLNGLSRVNGPHWSQILALYGRGGSISEVLKDRNQVQLKDKARNLKLWYLKMGKDVPPALRGVTGELRKRGGARARAALGMAEDGEQGGDADMADADGEADGNEIDPSLERRESLKPAKGTTKKKTRKGS